MTADNPALAPEWAVEMAIAATPIPHPFGAMRPAEVECFRDRLARLLATLRERTLREAADVVYSLPVPLVFAQHGIMGVPRMTAAEAITALVGTAPSSPRDEEAPRG